MYLKPIDSILPRLINIKITKPNKFRLSDNNENNSLPNIPPISSIPIEPGDSDSVIVAKIHQHSVIAKGYLDIQLMREQRQTQIEQESLPFDDFLSIPLTPILPNDSESTIVSKINMQTHVYKAQLEIQLMKEKYLFELKTMRETNILILISTCLFSMSIIIFGVCLRDGLIGKISETGKFIDSIVFNKLTYTCLFGTYFIGVVYVFFGDEIGKGINKVISGVRGVLGVFKRKK